MLILDCTDGSKSSVQITDKDNQRDLSRKTSLVKKILNRAIKELDDPVKNVVGPAVLSAAELVLQKYYINTLDNTIPIPIQTSQMTVYPELSFQLMILRSWMEPNIHPSLANTTCSNSRYCGNVTYKTKFSRQLWDWMTQLLQVHFSVSVVFETFFTKLIRL